REYSKGGAHDFIEVGLKGGPSSSSGHSPTLVGQFVPHRRSNRALRAKLIESLNDRRIGPLRDWDGHDARVQQIAQRHRTTLRPVVLPRTADAKSPSSPISSSAWR